MQQAVEAVGCVQVCVRVSFSSIFRRLEEKRASPLSQMDRPHKLAAVRSCISIVIPFENRLHQYQRRLWPAPSWHPSRYARSKQTGTPPTTTDARGNGDGRAIAMPESSAPKAETLGVRRR